MNVRPGVAWIESPFPYFSSHGWSELQAMKLVHRVVGKKIEVEIPKSISPEDRATIISRLREIPFDGIEKFTSVFRDDNILVVTIVAV